MNKIIIYTANFVDAIFMVSAKEQKKRCLEYAEKVGHAVCNPESVKEFTDENIEFRSPICERKEFTNLLTELETKKYDTLLIENTILLGLENRKMWEIFSKLDKLGVSLHTTSLMNTKNDTSTHLIRNFVMAENYIFRNYSSHYQIFTGNKDIKEDTKYRGTIRDFKFIRNILENSELNGDNYLEVTSVVKLEKHLIYKTERTIREDIDIIMEKLQEKA